MTCAIKENLKIKFINFVTKNCLTHDIYILTGFTFNVECFSHWQLYVAVLKISVCKYFNFSLGNFRKYVVEDRKCERLLSINLIYEIWVSKATNNKRSRYRSSLITIKLFKIENELNKHLQITFWSNYPKLYSMLCREPLGTRKW